MCAQALRTTTGSFLSPPVTHTDFSAHLPIQFHVLTLSYIELAAATTVQPASEEKASSDIDSVCWTTSKARVLGPDRMWVWQVQGKKAQEAYGTRGGGGVDGEGGL